MSPTVSAMRCCLTAEAAVARATLDFAVAGGRTALLRQHVPYPFHVTRPFYLDPERPDLATLYLQSASGGIYRNERLALTITAGRNAAAAVTTQSATIVHDCRGQPATQTVHLALGQGSLLVYAPDPVVLFPGAALRTILHLTLAPGAIALCQDGFACHDPAGHGSAFDHIASETIVRTPDGHQHMTDRGLFYGATLDQTCSPLGPYGAAGGIALLGKLLPHGKVLQDRIDALGCLSGVSALPNGIGTGIRLLATDGGALARGLAVAFSACFQAAVGALPAARRK